MEGKGWPRIQCCLQNPICYIPVRQLPALPVSPAVPDLVPRVQEGGVAGQLHARTKVEPSLTAVPSGTDQQARSLWVYWRGLRQKVPPWLCWQPGAAAGAVVPGSTRCIHWGLTYVHCQPKAGQRPAAACVPAQLHQGAAQQGVGAHRLVCAQVEADEEEQASLMAAQARYLEVLLTNYHRWDVPSVTTGTRPAAVLTGGAPGQCPRQQAALPL